MRATIDISGDLNKDEISMAKNVIAIIKAVDTTNSPKNDETYIEFIGKIMKIFARLIKLLIMMNGQALPKKTALKLTLVFL